MAREQIVSSVSHKTATASIWTIGGKFLARLLDFVSLLVLARLLSPADFGIVAIATSVLVIVEAILSFVNLSISTDQPTWGGMIAEGRTSIYQAWWVLVFPLIALFLTVLSFAQFGEGLRERFDPVLR